MTTLRGRLLRGAIRLHRRMPFPRLRRAVEAVWARYEARGRHRTVIATIDGIVFQLDLGELIDSNLYYKGSFEPDTTAAIRRLCRSGDVALDIGANVGCHTLRMAQLVGNTGRVIAFEPMPWARSKLERNLSLNEFHNVEVVDLGLADVEQSADVQFRSSWRLTDAASEEDPASVSAQPVRFVRLDDFLVSRAVERVDFIKLDVDGYELKVLRGAAKTLEQQGPTLIMELGSYTLRSAGDSIEELVTFLTSRGYRFYDERTLAEFASRDALLASVPHDATIDVIVSRRPV